MKQVISGLLLLGVVVMIVIYFLNKSGGGAGDHIVFQTPAKIYIGVPFNLVVNVNNDTGNIWRDVKLSLTLPDGLVFFGSADTKSFEIKDLGNLGSGSLTQVNFKLMRVFVDGETDEYLEALLSFSPAGVGSRFEEKKKLGLVNVQPALDLVIDTPPVLVNGEKFNLKINYKNLTNSDLEDMYLQIAYPEGFSFEKSDLEPEESKDNVWNLNSLRNGSEGSLTVSGKILSTASSSLEFLVSAMRQAAGYRHLINKTAAKINMGEAPLSVVIDLNETPEYVARPGDTLNYAIGYAINKTIKGSDKVIIKAKLTGSIFDLATVSVGEGGLIQPGSNQIVWNLSGQDLEGGSATFLVRVRNDYDIKRLGDRHFVLKVEAEATSGKYSSKAELQTKVAGKISLESKGYFRDAAAGILNKGPMPPKVGQPTNYTIHWKITNYANDVKNVAVKALLPPGVLLTNFSQSTINSKPALDTSTNEVVWQVGRVGATTGVLNQPPEATFQIQAIPTFQSTGQYLPLLGETKIFATDDFTSVDLSQILPALTTSLPDDPTIGASGIVVP